MQVPPRRRRDGRRGSDAAGAEQRGSLRGREEGRPRHFFSCSPLRPRLMRRCSGLFSALPGSWLVWRWVGAAVAREDKAAKS